MITTEMTIIIVTNTEAYHVLATELSVSLPGRMDKMGSGGLQQMST